MKWLVCVLTTAAALLHAQLPAAAPVGQVSAERWFIYSSLLATTDSDSLKLAARSITAETVNDSRVTDLAAKVLWEYLQEQRLINSDTVAWLARALGSSESTRYRALLEQLIASKPGNIARHATAALADLKTPAEEFQPSDVDLTALRDSAVAAAASSSKAQSRLFAAQSGMKIEEVVSTIGYPTEVAVAFRHREASYGQFSVSNLGFKYEGYGEVEFIHDKGDWVVSLITPVPLSRHLEGADPSLIDIRKALLGPDVVEFRRVAALTLRQQTQDQTTLDLAAWKLQSHLHANELYVIDGLRYLCQTIAKSGNARYREILERVSTEATNSKLRRNGAKALEDLPKTAVEQFDGTIE